MRFADPGQKRGAEKKMQPKEHGNLRQLGEIVCAIRIPTMDAKLVAEKVAFDGILDDTEN